MSEGPAMENAAGLPAGETPLTGLSGLPKLKRDRRPLEPEAPPKPRGPGCHFGRTALLIHGLGALAFGVTVTLFYVLKEGSEESGAVQGVGVATTMVFALWSGILAFRGLWAGEHLRWPILILLVVGVECSAVSLLLWWPLLTFVTPADAFIELLLWLGLPVFVPFLVAASLVAAPLAWWRARGAERRDAARGGKPWEHRRRMKRGLAWYAGTLAALAALVLPFPLYIYLVLQQNYRAIWRVPADWQGAALRAMPDYVRQTVDWALATEPYRGRVRYREVLIEKGLLPKRCLLRRLGDDYGAVRVAARCALYARFPDEALARLNGDLAHSDPQVRREAAAWTYRARAAFPDWPSALQKEWVAALLRALDDSDLAVRRGAAWGLHVCVRRAPFNPKATPKPWETLAAGQPPPERPGEREELEALRAAADEWLRN
jgi:hypothetical protein